MAPVHPELRAKDDVEDEGESEAGRDEGVVDFGGSGEEASEAAEDLGEDGKGRELACALGASVLRDLRELREQAQWERRCLSHRELLPRDCGEGVEGSGGKDGIREQTLGLGCARAGRGVEDDEEGDEGVLDGEKEVLAVGAERKVVAHGVGEGDGVGEGFEDVGREREATGGRGVDDCQGFSMQVA